MYCQHNSKLEERQWSVKLFCASTVRGMTDNKTQCSSSSQCILAAYPLLQAEETRNENCGINQSNKARNAWMPNLQARNRKFRNISAQLDWLSHPLQLHVIWNAWIYFYAILTQTAGSDVSLKERSIPHLEHMMTISQICVHCWKDALSSNHIMFKQKKPIR